MNKLTFKDCKAFLNDELFSGKYELVRGDKYILGKVSMGILNNEKTFNKNILIMERKYNSCDSGIQKVFDLNGNIISEGMFSLNKRVGNGNILLMIVLTLSSTNNNYLLEVFYIVLFYSLKKD